MVSLLRVRERFPSRSLLSSASQKPSSGLFVVVIVDQCLTHQSAAAVGTAVGVTEHGWTNGEHRETRGAGRQHFAVFKVEAGEGTLPKVTRPVRWVPVEQGTSTRTQRRPSKEGDEQEIADIATGQRITREYKALAMNTRHASKRMATPASMPTVCDCDTPHR